MDHAALLEGLAPDEVEKLVALAHADPHHVLGTHPVAAGVIVRAFRPDAAEVRLLPDDPALAPRAMERVHPGGLFATRVDGVAAPFPYRLEVRNHEGRTYQFRDAYTFLPTLGELDLYLAAQGQHRRLYEKLGAHVRRHGDVTGVAFAVWAPNARRVSVVGDWCAWDGRYYAMRKMGATGIWELFVPDLRPGTRYKFEIVAANGDVLLKQDPYAFQTELRPGTAGIVRTPPAHRWADAAWMEARAKRDPLRAPMAIYEVHLGSWMRVPEEGNRWLTYRELAVRLGDYVQQMGFTHVELLPVAEHPFDGSWGYQVTGYFAPTSRYGTPDDFRYFVDQMHARGIGVILDWVPAHFPRDAWALARFDGTALYEHADPRQGEHPDWGTLVFNYGRNEVRNFLLANALYWLDEFHVDGLRVDAVASMLYLDYSRKPGEWVPNRYGGRENLEAISFLRELNELVHGAYPGAVMIAEESTVWPAVSRPTYVGGLGFTFKWNMGWMHDTLKYFSLDPVFRRFHHNQLTFGLWYAYSENFVLPLSHDEVVHMKGSLLGKMPGDAWQRFANLRALLGYMWCHPGKKLLFMGGEFGQEREWNHDASLDWHLLQQPLHAGVAALVRDLNAFYRAHPPLWDADIEPAGFEWIVVNDSDQSVAAFARFDRERRTQVVCVLNATPVVRPGYRIGVPAAGEYREAINSDAAVYGGSNVGNYGAVQAQPVPSHGFPYSLELTLPPLAMLILEGPPLPPRLEHAATGAAAPSTTGETTAAPTSRA
jgi:1,4-alpha-glucan branching enzyme